MEGSVFWTGLCAYGKVLFFMDSSISLVCYKMMGFCNFDLIPETTMLKTHMSCANILLKFVAM